MLVKLVTSTFVFVSHVTGFGMLASVRESRKTCDSHWSTFARVRLSSLSQVKDSSS